MIEELTQRQMISILPIKLSERHTILSKGMIFLPGKSNFPEYVLQEQKSAHSVFLPSWNTQLVHQKYFYTCSLTIRRARLTTMF